jgi:hypothetical protein
MEPQQQQTHALFRVEVSTGRQRFLVEYPSAPTVALSPSRRWLAIHSGEAGEALSLVSTTDGRWRSLPVDSISSYFWGGSDETLYVLTPNGWRRARLRIGTGGNPAPLVKPDPMRIPLSRRQAVRWEPLGTGLRPARPYGAPEIVTARHVQGQTWLGTRHGLRVLDPEGRDVPLTAWQAALRGWRVDAIAPDGERVWLAVRIAFGGSTYQSGVVRVDRRSGEAVARFLQPSGVGSGDYIRQILPGADSGAGCILPAAAGDLG